MITIVAMFTIVAINHNCRNANHNCRNFFEKFFNHIININRWLKDGVSLGFLDLNPIFHNIVAILLGKIAQYILVAYNLSAETKFRFIIRASPQF